MSSSDAAAASALQHCAVAAARATRCCCACPPDVAAGVAGVDVPGPDVAALVERARVGDARAVGRLISLVENASPVLREVMTALTPYAGSARVVGLTGSPGVGKSTTTAALVRA